MEYIVKYVIKRNGLAKGGVYVAKPGRKHSYTNSLKYARKFDSVEEAQRELCPENERIVPLDGEIN